MSAGGSDLSWQTQRVDGGTIFPGNGGSRDPKAPQQVPSATIAVEHYNRIVRLLDHGQPVRLERLQAALLRVQRRRGAAALQSPAEIADELLLAQERGRLRRVPVRDVLYLKAELKYVTVRTAQASYLLEDSLSALEAFQNGGDIAMFRKVGAGRWQVQTGASSLTCLGPKYFQQSVFVAWSLAASCRD